MEINKFGIDEDVYKIVNDAEFEIRPQFEQLDKLKEFSQFKVLDAFRKNRISAMHFGWNTGYGYDDPGRDATEKVFADVFGGEAALVRPLIVNGTHALSLCLLGILRPGDELICCTGEPYDTMEEVIGIRDNGNDMGSLKDYGVKYRQIELTPEGKIDLAALRAAIGPNTKMVHLQRSTGYSMRKAFLLSDIEECFKMVHSVNPNIICMTDNCYGEFLDEKEPVQIGADLMAGSLIKNPGGGLALSGGYVCGRKDLVERIAYRMTCPGIGGECGLTFGQTRSILQGLFVAPQTVTGAVKGAILCGKVFENLGFKVSPLATDKRSDIIEAVQLGSAEAMKVFCRGIQKAAPIDSFVSPEPSDMPGYSDKVIMACGAFVDGSSIELSCDGPLREPYTIYFQGGLTYEHSKFGVLSAVQEMKNAGLI